MPRNPRAKPGVAPGNTHNITFSDGYQTWGALLDGGPRGIQEVPQTPSTLLFTNGGGRYGDNEAGLSHLEQRDWTGGRGQENFGDDNSRYFDGQALWSLTPDMLLPAPQWKLPTNGYAPGDRNLPGSVEWRKLYGNERFLAVSFTPAAGLTCDTVYLWVRRRGNPGTLSMEIDSNSGGSPSTIVTGATATLSTISDTISELHSFDFSGTVSLTGGTTYWIKIFGASTDSETSHWEVGTERSGSNGKSSPDNGTWSSSSYPPYFWASTTTNAEITDLAYKFFTLEGTAYAVQRTHPGNTVGANSIMWQNGDRGECDSNSAAKGTLIDATKSWTTNQWAGCKVKIVAGPGLGEWRSISSNNSTTLTVSRNWNTTQTTASRYAIYDTDQWVLVSGIASLPSSFTVTDVEVIDNLAFIACGTNPIRQMRNNSTGAVQFDTTETATAGLLKAFYHPDDGVQLWRTLTTGDVSIARAVPSTYGGTMTFGTAIPIGEDSRLITNLVAYDDELWVLKEDSLWRVKNDRPSKLDLGLDAMPAVSNGAAACAKDLYLYFSWSHSVERLYGGTLDDMGPWSGAGLPAGRTGPISALLPVIGWLFAAVDGGPSGTSSILANNGRGWHEIFRGFETGRRIRSLFWLPTEGGQPKLYFSFGSFFLYLTFPADALHPLRDTSMPYQHEAVLTTSTFDMGTLRLPKFFKEFEAVLDNLRPRASSAVGKEIFVDMQTDDRIGTTQWTEMGVLADSPVDALQLNQGSKRAMRLRLRINTNEATVPVKVRATVLECFARAPVKYQYNLRLKVSSLQRDRRGQLDGDPDLFIWWLKQQAASASPVLVRSEFQQWDDKLVIIEPPSIIRAFVNNILGWMGGIVTVTVRDV